MKTYRWILGIVAAALLLVGAAGSSFAWEREPQGQGKAQAALGTAFTYQGTLTDGGNPADGDYDFQFALYDAQTGGTQVGSAVTKNDVAVSEGTFTVKLNFGGVFDGAALWLEIGVRAGSSTGSYTTLSPRQELTPAPYALGLVPGATVNGLLNGTGVLSLTNRADDGLRVEEAGGDGVQVSSASYGLYVKNANFDGLLINSAGNDGVYIGQAESDGVYVASANYGVSVASSDTDGIFVNNADADGDGIGIAGYFDGDVRVTDHLTATNLYAVSKKFVIDHPLDPENRYLYHSSVESPDRMNVYNGNVTLDEHGEASVQLPDYFDALNRDFRYQLTPIGGPGPNLYVAEEIQENRFKIAGGDPGLKVSWQVTGIRDDASARSNPMRVEVDKPDEKKGLYLDPEAYGQPASQGIDRVGRGAER
jgi:hypothetical protein